MGIKRAPQHRVPPGGRRRIIMLLPKLVLSPVDFSKDSLEALDVAVDVARRYGSEVLLVHVVPAIPKLPGDVSILHEGQYERQLIENAEQELQDLAKQVRERGPQARTAV